MALASLPDIAMEILAIQLNDAFPRFRSVCKAIYNATAGYKYAYMLDLETIEEEALAVDKPFEPFEELLHFSTASSLLSMVVSGRSVYQVEHDGDDTFARFQDRVLRNPSCMAKLNTVRCLQLASFPVRCCFCSRSWAGPGKPNLQSELV